MQQPQACHEDQENQSGMPLSQRVLGSLPPCRAQAGAPETLPGVWGKQLGKRPPSSVFGSRHESQ